MQELLALILAGIHFFIPLAYYWYAKAKWLPKPWNIKVDENHKPEVSVIVPTYKEAKFVRDRLDNIHVQDYPKSLMKIIVVDSDSNDGTTELVEKWVCEHKDINLKLLEEPKRCGMLPALNYALQRYPIDGEIVVFTDADALWDYDALTKVVKYFADLDVGAVTASITPTTPVNDFHEGAYRSYYNILRMAESKIHSTPIHNGAFMAFRTSLLRKMGELPCYTGNNDSTPASIMAFMGYRVIQVNDVVVKEPVKKNQFQRKVRRAQHLLLSFLKTKRYVSKLGVYRPIQRFEKVWKVEWWLHVANPWLLVGSVILLIEGAYYVSFTALMLLGIGLILLVLKAYRTWVLQQVYLTMAAIRNLWTKEIAWSK